MQPRWGRSLKQTCKTMVSSATDNFKDFRFNCTKSHLMRLRNWKVGNNINISILLIKGEYCVVAARVSKA